MPRSHLESPYELEPLNTSTSTFPSENIMEHHTEHSGGYSDQREHLLGEASPTVATDEKKGEIYVYHPVDVLRFPILQA